MSVKVTIVLDLGELRALEREYKAKGLGLPNVGSVMAPLDSVHRKLVEEVRRLSPAPAEDHVRTFGNES